MKSTLRDIEVYLHHQTDKAYLVSADGDVNQSVWVPKSQCEMEHVRGHICEMTAEQSLLEEKDLV